MKRFTFLIILLACIRLATAQIHQVRNFPELSGLQRAGWQIQHSCTSFDKRTIIFSAKTPNSRGFDLYEMHKQNNKWTTPVALNGINTPLDELWPSMTSDEQQIYFVQRTPAIPNNKKSEDQYTILLSTKQNDSWESGQTIIISTGEDISPLILPDNQTLLFASKREIPGKKERQYALYFTRKIGKYNWYLPTLIHAPEEKGINYYGIAITASTANPTIQFTKQTCSKKDTTYTTDYLPLDSAYNALPVMTLSGMVKDKNTGHLINNTIAIYDAITSKLLCRLNNEGQYTIALPVGTSYHIDVTAPNYSHHYIEQDCRQLKVNASESQTITLAKSLRIHINIFDADMQIPLKDVQYRISSNKINKVARAAKGEATLDLPIGDLYTIVFSKNGYGEAPLTINTKKEVLLTESELDIDLTPAKVPVHIALFDIDTKEPITGSVQLSNPAYEENINYIADSTFLRQGETYALHASATEYVYCDTTITLPYSAMPTNWALGLRQLKQELVLQLRNILFEYNSAVLMESSYNELNKVVRLLEENPTISIELSAHTDDRGTDAYNDKLSKKRGEAVRTYLVKNGIHPQRITATGYGKKRPLVPNDSETNRAINRRVEFKVTGM